MHDTSGRLLRLRTVRRDRRACSNRTGSSPRATVHAPTADLRTEVRTAADTLDWLAFRLLGLSREFTVHEPPELVDHLRALAGLSSARSAARHRGAKQAR